MAKLTKVTHHDDGRSTRRVLVRDIARFRFLSMETNTRRVQLRLTDYDGSDYVIECSEAELDVAYREAKRAGGQAA